MRIALALSVVLLAACGGGGSAEEPGLSAGMPAPGGGLTVEEALAAEGGEPLLVKGHVVGRDGELRLCSVLLESFPPQCGEPSLRIEGELDAELEEAEGVRWSEELVSLLGRVEDGVIRLSETST